MTFNQQIELQLNETLMRLCVGFSEHEFEISYIDFVNEQLPKVVAARDHVRSK